LTAVAASQATTDSLAIADFDYTLPNELIAQHPLERRDDSRLMVLERGSGRIAHSSMACLGDWLAAGDLLIANDSRVIPARLLGRRLPSGGAAELLLLRVDDGAWTALARPAKHLQPGSRLEFPARSGSAEPAIAVIESNLGQGEVRVRFEAGADARLDEYGVTPLPPYIHEPLADSARYQTVYAKRPGSAAAPTAGLHFTDELIARVRDAGIEWAQITLHVGLDTFRPVTEQFVEDHAIHQEWCEVSQETAEAIAECRARGGRVVAIGTTATRTLETLGRTWDERRPAGYAGYTDTFIVPGHRWRLVDALLTNFHLPRSTLLLLVSALAGRDAVLNAYAEAIREGYRFFSFGDAMLIR
jgi:S-adenosylmethionine:tRNA ribosyltransferase-isomerase